MRLFFFLVALIFSSNAAPADARLALAAFDGICVSTGARLSVIEKMAAGTGAKAVPNEVLAADAAVAEHGGKGFVFTQGNYRFIAIATPIGSCSILAPLLPKQDVIAHLERNYSLSKPFIEFSGPQVRYLYRIIEPSIHSGGYVSLMFPKEGEDATMFSIGFIAQQAAAKLRIGKRQ